MDDVAWTQVLLERHRDQAIGFAACRRAFDEILGDARVQWDDSAARHIFQRLIEPLQAEGQAFQNAWSQLRTCLDQIRSALTDAIAPEMAVLQWSEDVARLKRCAIDELDCSYRAVDAALNYRVNADAELTDCLAIARAAGVP